LVFFGRLDFQPPFSLERAFDYALFDRETDIPYSSNEAILMFARPDGMKEFRSSGPCSWLT
jgi:hypothetical protein